MSVKQSTERKTNPDISPQPEDSIEDLKRDMEISINKARKVPGGAAEWSRCEYRGFKARAQALREDFPKLLEWAWTH